MVERLPPALGVYRSFEKPPCAYIYIYVWAGGYPPPVFRDNLIIMFIKSRNYNSFYVMCIYIYVYMQRA